MKTKDIMFAFDYDAMIVRTNAPKHEIENLLRKFCEAYEDGHSCYDALDEFKEHWYCEVLYDSESDLSRNVPYYDIGYNVANYFED